MKICIKTLTGNTGNININDDATVGEVRSQIARAMPSISSGTLEDRIELIGSISFTDGTLNRCVVYRDDPSDLKLIALFQQYNPDLQPAELTACLLLNLGPHNNRPTVHNPEEIQVHYAELRKEKYNSQFFRSMYDPTSEKTFTQRLNDINFQGEIPDKFLDYVTTALMDNPMLTSDTHNYDAKTIKRLNSVSPITRAPFNSVTHNTLLRSQLEEFVSAQERIANIVDVEKSQNDSMNMVPKLS